VYSGGVLTPFNKRQSESSGWLAVYITPRRHLAQFLPGGRSLCGDVRRDELHPPFQLELLKIFGHKA